MKLLSRVFVVLILSGLFIPNLFARGVDETVGEEAPSRRIVQVGSAAFIVQNALYLFPEAVSQVIAIADGDQGNGLFVGDLDPQIANKTIIPKKVNIESILALNPDVVVMKNFMKDSIGEPLERLGIQTVYLDLETPEAWMEDLDQLGELFKNPERAAELKLLFESGLSSIEDRLSELSESQRPSTLFLYWSVKDGASAVNVPPMGWIQAQMVEMAGGIPVWKDADLSNRWTRVNIEQVAAWDPDQIIVAAYHIPTGDAVNAITADPLWAQLSAVKAGNVHAFPVDYHSWDQPDARWLLGTMWLARQLHPDMFAHNDMEAETRQFYKDFFFMDKDDYNRMIEPRLTVDID